MGTEKKNISKYEKHTHSASTCTLALTPDASPLLTHCADPLAKFTCKRSENSVICIHMTCCFTVGVNSGWFSSEDKKQNIVR